MSNGGNGGGVLMRAKMTVSSVEKFNGCEKVKMFPVARSGSYPEDGSDENNTYAKFSPSGSLELMIANPDLVGKIEPGQTFYLDFAPVDAVNAGAK